jgi:hypothetical protein
VAVLGGEDIFGRSGRGVDPYFHLPMFGPPDGLQKVWFFLRNDADVPVPAFTGSHPIPQPNSGYGLVRKDLCGLQPLCEIIQWLLHEGLTGANLLRAFFSSRVQLLH